MTCSENEFNTESDTESDNDCKIYQQMLHNIIVNWPNIQNDETIRTAIDSNNNAKTLELRLAYPEESNKLIHCRSFAYTLFIFNHIMRCNS